MRDNRTIEEDNRTNPERKTNKNDGSRIPQVGKEKSKSNRTP